MYARHTRSLAWVLIMTVVCWAGVALAAEPFKPGDALSPWTDESFHVAGNFGNIQQVIAGILASPLVALDPSVSEDLAGFQALNAQYPVDGVAFAGGLQKGVLRFQLAVALAPSRADLLDRLSKGALTSDDLAFFTEGGVTVEGPLPLDEGIQAYRIPLEDTPLAFHIAATNNLFLMGLTPEDIKGSFAALKDPAVRFAPKRRFPEAPNYFLFQDNGFIQMALLAAEMPYLLHANILGELSFALEEHRWLLGIFTNMASAVASSKELEAFKPLASPLPLVGSGTVLGAAHFATYYDYFKDSLLHKGDQDTREFVEEALQGAQEIGIAEEDLRQLLTGSMGLVLGGTGAFASAPLPGLYAVLEGQGEGAKKIAETLVKMLQQNEMPFAKVEVPGWDMVFGMPLPATVTVAVKGSTLLVGFLDANQLAAPAEPSAKLKEIAARTDLYNYLFVDNEALQKELLQFLKGAEIWASILGGDLGELGHAVFQAHAVLARVKHIVMECTGLEKGTTVLEFFTPDQAVEAEWKATQEAWEKAHPMAAPEAPAAEEPAEPVSGDTPPPSN